MQTTPLPPDKVVVDVRVRAVVVVVVAVIVVRARVHGHGFASVQNADAPERSIGLPLAFSGLKSLRLQTSCPPLSRETKR